MPTVLRPRIERLSAETWPLAKRTASPSRPSCTSMLDPELVEPAHVPRRRGDAARDAVAGRHEGRPTARRRRRGPTGTLGDLRQSPAPVVAGADRPLDADRSTSASIEPGVDAAVQRRRRGGGTARRTPARGRRGRRLETSASAAAKRAMHASTALESAPASRRRTDRSASTERPPDLGDEARSRSRHVSGRLDVAVLGEFGIDHVKFQQIQGVWGRSSSSVSSSGGRGHDL